MAQPVWKFAERGACPARKTPSHMQYPCDMEVGLRPAFCILMIPVPRGAGRVRLCMASGPPRGKRLSGKTCPGHPRNGWPGGFSQRIAPRQAVLGEWRPGGRRVGRSAVRTACRSPASPPVSRRRLCAGGPAGPTLPARSAWPCAQ